MHQISKIRGYAGLDWNERLPDFWYEALTTTKENEYRRMITERVVQWMKGHDQGVLTHGIHFTKTQIEDILKAEFTTPAGANGVLEGAHKGLTILGLLLYSPEEKIAIRNMEEREEEARNTLRVSDIDKKERKMVRTPPKNWYELVPLFGVVCGTYHTLFGERSTLYQQCMQIYLQLVSSYCAKNHEKYTPELCRKVVWAVHEGTGEFFDQEVSVRDFDAQGKMVGAAPFCQIKLIIEQVRFIQPINRPTYPTKWKLLDASDEAARQPPFGSWNNGGSSNWAQPGGGTSGDVGGPRGGHNPGGGRGTPFHQQQGQGAPKITEQQLRQQRDDCHPAVKEVMKEYWARRPYQGVCLIGEILTKANLRYNDLPYLNSMISNNNKNTQCYGAAIGICKRVDCSFRHVPGAQAGEGFSKELAQKIKPGVDRVVAELSQRSPAGGGHGGGSGRPIKQEPGPNKRARTDGY